MENILKKYPPQFFKLDEMKRKKEKQYIPEVVRCECEKENGCEKLEPFLLQV
jgi:hypothetical protein